MKSRPPLHYRVPNPVQDARSPDTAAVITHLREYRVARVFEAGGGFASDVVLRALDEGLPELRDEAIYVRLAAFRQHDLSSVMLALAQTAGIEPAGAMLIGSGSEARATLIDLADAVQRLVVVDGVDCRQTEWRDTIDAVSRYSRCASWIFIESGVAPLDDSSAFTVRETPRRALVVALEPREQALVDAVATVGRVPWDRVPPDLRAIGAPLAKRGVLLDDGTHWSADGAPLTAERETAAAERLLRFDDGPALLVAAEILMRHGRETESVERLEKERDRLIAEGLGLSVWDLLRRSGADPAKRLRLAIAARIHAPRAIAETSPAARPHAVDRFHYAQLLLERNRATDAAMEVERAIAVADGSVDPDELKLFLAQCHLARSAPDEAVAALDDVEGTDDVVLLRRDVLRLGTAITTRADGLDEWLDELVGRLRRLKGADLHAGRLDLVRALHLRGRIREALALLDDRPSNVGRSLYTSSENAYVGALLNHASGRLDEAGELCERLLRAVDRGSMLGLHVRLLRVATEQDRGALDAALRHATELLVDVNSSEYRPLAAATQLALATLRWERDGIASVPRFDADDDGWFGPRLRDLDLRLRLRRGELPACELAPDASPGLRLLAMALGGPSHELVELDSQLVDARARGDLRRASSLAKDLALAAVAMGEDDAGERVALWCDVARAAGHNSSAELAEFLQGVRAKTIPFRALLDRAGTGPIGRLALEIAAPGTSADSLERRLAASLRQDAGWEIERRDDAPPWWIDATSRVVHLERRVIDLGAQHVRWAFLAGLVERGGRATKAELISRVWGISDHHPLEDENRLRLAAFKLRRQLGDAAERIVTTDDGYALGVGACIIRASNQSSSAHTSE